VSATVFDRLAARYDECWTTTPTGRAQRDAVWRAVDPLFCPGQRVLDVGCGTGEDAAHYSARGVTVHAVDASPAMVRAAERRGGFTTEVLSAEELSRMGGIFDGVISNFGALNCVRDLADVAQSMARLTRPGAVAAVCLMGHICLWETLYYLTRLQFRKAFRRWSGSGVAYREMRVYYPSTAAVREAFGEGFELRSWSGTGLCVPPSYVKLPARAVAWLAELDTVLARVPLLRAMADHRLYIMVRK
jgi:ubiquinone/menaquinone biosynthesis C-methylase UbiE